MKNCRSSTVLALSGGMDSSTLLFWLLERGVDVHALMVDYGQRHFCELQAARRVLTYARAEYHAKGGEFGQVLSDATVNLQSLRGLLPGSSQTDPKVAVPEGDYRDATMRLTVVPNRNMILLALAAARAIAKEARTFYGDRCPDAAASMEDVALHGHPISEKGILSVTYGAHRGDHAIYPDCRPEFITALGGALALCHYDPVVLVAPFSNMDKGDICIEGVKLKVPYHLTWTCYKGGGEKPCGRCGACVERAEAFAKAGVPDPLTAQDAQEGA